VRGFEVTRDPQSVEEFEDIVGLYMSPPEHALVPCGGENSQLQTLDRTQPGLPLNVLDGMVIGQCQQRHTHAEWLKFLRQVDRETPDEPACRNWKLPSTGTSPITTTSPSRSSRPRARATSCKGNPGRPARWRRCRATRRD
jgi:hypothetical protein